MGSSSEIVDFGKVSGQKSNFSQTCSLLSQYLKENGGFGELSLGLNRSFESNGKFYCFTILLSLCLAKLFSDRTVEVLFLVSILANFHVILGEFLFLSLFINGSY